MPRVADFGRGAYPTNSNVVASRTITIPTSVVSVPVTRYGQGSTVRKRGRKGR